MMDNLFIQEEKQVDSFVPSSHSSKLAIGRIIIESLKA